MAYYKKFDSDDLYTRQDLGDVIANIKEAVDNGTMMMIADQLADACVNEWFKGYSCFKLADNLWLVGYDLWLKQK